MGWVVGARERPELTARNDSVATSPRALAEEALAAYSRRDWAAAERCCHPDARVSVVSSAGAVVSADEVARLTAADDARVLDFQINSFDELSPEAIIMSGRVVERRGAGVIADSAYYCLLTFKDGLIWRAVTVRAPEEARDLLAKEGLDLGIGPG